MPLSEISARSGISIPRVMRAMLAAGIPVTAESKVPVNLVALMEAFETGSALMGDDAILAFTASSARRPSTPPRRRSRSSGRNSGRVPYAKVRTRWPRAYLSEAASRAFMAVPDVMAQAVMDQFIRAQRRSQEVRGWSDSSFEGDPGGQTEVVALGFVDPGRLDSVGADPRLPGAESCTHPFRVGRLVQCGPQRWPCGQDDR